MKKIFLNLLFTIACILPIQAFAVSLPFNDIDENNQYYNSISKLYEAGIIYDDGSHKFNPNETMNRDFFVSLATQIGCKDCLTPSTQDIIKYDISPFVDLPKTNKFYYCIAYAYDNNITQGYNIDPYNNLATCENSSTFSSSPFCPQNSTTRIEAAAMLLRQAKLWNDTLNSSNFEKNENFTDIEKNNYWYGYAKKALEIGIISKKSDGKIGFNDKLTKGEFAQMSAIILDYTQCNFKNKNNNSHASYIDIIDISGKSTSRTSFEEGEKFNFIPITETKGKNYDWTATSNGQIVIKGNGETFDGSKLPPGKWSVDVKIIDPYTNKIISNPSVTVSVIPKNNDTDGDGVKNSDDKCPTVPGPASNNGCPKNENDDIDGDGVKNSDDKCPTVPGPASNNGCPVNTKIGVSLIPNPSVTYIGNPITFTPQISGGSNDLTYSWDFGDGSRSSTPGIQKHPYNNPGTYTVTVTITNPKTGETGQSTTIIRITNNKDSDGDGVTDDNDNCPFVKGTNAGCPNIKTHDYGCSIKEMYSGNKNCNHTSLIPKNENDTDGDGVKNSDDKCPTVPGPTSNNGCPKDKNNDTDGDGVMDNVDSCPKIKGLPEWNGCLEPNIYKNISNNVCLLNKLENQGLLIGEPVCNICPCNNKLDITSTLRECDVLFPTILSLDKQTIYSRGNFYILR